MVKVRIIKDKHIYFNDVFNVINEDKKFYYLRGISGFFSIRKQDAEVVQDVENSCETCGLSLGNRKKDIFCEEVVGTCKDYDKWQPIEQVEEVIAGVGQDAPTAKQIGKFENIGMELGKLTDEKREAYGNSATIATEVMKLLYPQGIKIEQMNDMLLIVRVLDKICRIANKKDAFGENPWADVVGYGLIGVEHE